ncbi:oxidative stress-responsive serine-rich protein 1 [Trichomycterus rosablanca]|uniref:oxidative stress-responsive serine-rich protein 1 n=1 Tax=Trichomycterus rosablanca TaxID=2290929 RepID=UPI002F35972C
MVTVKTGEKVCEEETLQTAFKKLRVDAESSAAAVSVCEALASGAGVRVITEGAKPKITSPKENWHGCTRKPSRGVVRRRRRSKSPILHPPKFTYCSSKSKLKHKSPAEPEDAGASSLVPAKKELLSSSAHSPVFGASGYDSSLALKSKITSPKQDIAPLSRENDSEKKNERSDTSSENTETPAADFKSLWQSKESDACPCGSNECHCASWRGVEVYSFTGLRDVISECESKLPSYPDVAHSSRTENASSTSNSPRSCSEQARAYVDDVTIEDLSGYMEYYLYIPKKMSHMAEMMYT